MWYNFRDQLESCLMETNHLILEEVLLYMWIKLEIAMLVT